MNDLCSYDRDGQYEVNDLRSECRGLRTDVDNLLAEINDLKRALGMLRNRVDHNEMVPA